MTTALYIVAGILGVIGGIAVLGLVGDLLFRKGTGGMADEERAFTEHYEAREKQCAPDEPLPPIK